MGPLDGKSGVVLYYWTEYLETMYHCRCGDRGVEIGKRDLCPGWWAGGSLGAGRVYDILATENLRLREACFEQWLCDMWVFDPGSGGAIGVFGWIG